MSRRVVFAITITGFCFFIVACAPTSTATPAMPTRTRVPTLPALSTPTETRKPTVPPTSIPTSTATFAAVQPTVVVSATLPAVSPTALPTVTPAPTLTPAFAPGLYVSNLRIEPSPPVRGADLNFYVIFLNSAGTVYNPKWLVYIYRADTPNRSYSETTAVQSSIPAGTNEIKSNGTWKLGPGGPCDYFFARVGYLDANNRPIMYTQPDGAVFEKGFTVCPP